MNFKKIEIVFIFIFFFLDLFLFVNYRNGLKLQANSEKETTVNNAIKEMRKDNITVQETSEKKLQKGYLLSYSHKGNRPQVSQTNGVTFKPQKVTLTKPLIINNKNKIKVLREFLQKNSQIPYSNDYMYEKKLSTSKQIIFVQKYKNELFYDLTGQISFEIRNDHVINYQISHIDSLKSSKETETIISEKEAILKLYTLNEIPNNTKILWQKLAYSWMLETNNVSVYVPTWFIALQNKRTKSVNIEKINAFTGVLWKGSFN